MGGATFYFLAKSKSFQALSERNLVQYQSGFELSNSGFRHTCMIGMSIVDDS